MSLPQRRVILVIILMAASLVGLVSVQVYLLGLAMDQKDQAFRQSVFAALSAVSQRLETGETAELAFGTALPGAAGGQFQLFLTQDVGSDAESLTVHGIMVEHDDVRGAFEEEAAATPFSLSNGFLRYKVDAPQHVTIRVYDRQAGTDRVVVDTFRAPGDYEVDLTKEQLDQRQLMWVYRSDSSSIVLESGSGFTFRSLSPLVSQSRKGDFVKKVVSNLMITELEPIEERIDADRLDSLLRQSLTEVGIDLAHQFGIVSGSNDSLRVARPANYEKALRTSEFRSRLFPHDLLAARSDLVVHFPGRSLYLWKQMASLLSLSVLFTLIVVAVFGYTVRIIVAQKRFSQRIVEFINNMTHEFKTPISTVALATEAIMRPEAAADRDKLSRYGKMIMHENQRMRTQVEKILQMAVLEEGDYELKLEPVAMHELIAKAAETANLQVASRQGTLEIDLQAESDGVEGDPVHLLNVVNNLLDNAVKYSSEAPEIRVETLSADNRLRLRVIDKGIGISAHDLKQVFEKYYRVPTGNVHNVKGFGLGLSYVRLIVEAHHGEIAIESELGQGTCVTVSLPLTQSPGGGSDEA